MLGALVGGGGGDMSARAGAACSAVSREALLEAPARTSLFRASGESEPPTFHVQTREGLRAELGPGPSESASESPAVTLWAVPGARPEVMSSHEHRQETFPM